MRAFCFGPIVPTRWAVTLLCLSSHFPLTSSPCGAHTGVVAMATAQVDVSCSQMKLE